MAVFYGYTIMGRNHIAAMVFGFTDIAQYLTASMGCIYALYQMRNLRYYGEGMCKSHRSPINRNQVRVSRNILSKTL
jgi:hypothetical protein